MEPDSKTNEPQQAKTNEEPGVVETGTGSSDDQKKEALLQEAPAPEAEPSHPAGKEDSNTGPPASESVHDKPITGDKETGKPEEEANRPRKGKSKGKGKKGKPGKGKGMTPPKASPTSTPRSPGPYTPGTSASTPRTPVPAASLNPSRVLSFEVRNDSMKIRDMVKVHASAPMQLLKTTYMTSATMKISISYKHVSVAAHCKVSAIKDAAWLYMEYMPGPPAGADYSLKMDASLLRQAAKALWLQDCPSARSGDEIYECVRHFATTKGPTDLMVGLPVLPS